MVRAALLALAEGIGLPGKLSPSNGRQRSGRRRPPLPSPVAIHYGGDGDKVACGACRVGGESSETTLEAGRDGI